MTTTKRLAPAAAAALATDHLNSQHLTPAFQGAPPVVTEACIRDLRLAGRLTDDGSGSILEQEVSDLFTRTRVLDYAGLPIVRVSITPLGANGACDPLPATKLPRRFSGWDFNNRAGLPEDERWAGIEGVWPMSEVNAAQAARMEAFFLPSIKGFVDGRLIRRVTGYRLDLTTRRRWFETRPLADHERPLILTTKSRIKSDGENWEHVWINVSKGPVSSGHNLDEELAAYRPQS